MIVIFSLSYQQIKQKRQYYYGRKNRKASESEEREEKVQG